MGHLRLGCLSEAWKGEASDFTLLLVERLDQLSSAIGAELASAGHSLGSADREVRRIDIVAHGGDGSEFVIEHRYGRADHDRLTRGLAYAVLDLRRYPLSWTGPPRGERQPHHADFESDVTREHSRRRCYTPRRRRVRCSRVLVRLQP